MTVQKFLILAGGWILIVVGRPAAIPMPLPFPFPIGIMLVLIGLRHSHDPFQDVPPLASSICAIAMPGCRALVVEHIIRKRAPRAA